MESVLIDFATDFLDFVFSVLAFRWLLQGVIFIDN